ncbi:MAG: hypothetical protein ACLQEG_09585, partial [Acidimicrobiales bacterium]
IEVPAANGGDFRAVPTVGAYLSCSAPAQKADGPLVGAGVDAGAGREWAAGASVTANALRPSQAGFWLVH